MYRGRGRDQHRLQDHGGDEGRHEDTNTVMLEWLRLCLYIYIYMDKWKDIKTYTYVNPSLFFTITYRRSTVDECVRDVLRMYACLSLDSLNKMIFLWRHTFDKAADHVYTLLLKKDCYPRSVHASTPAFPRLFLLPHLWRNMYVHIWIKDLLLVFARNKFLMF